MAVRPGHNGIPQQGGSQGVLDQKFMQFVFFRQWKSLKKYCRERGIEIIGDIPIFVAHDSSDVRSNPELFDLDEKGNPRDYRRCASGLLQRNGTALGESAIPVGCDGRTVSLVD